jgi:hypothetical protein
MTIEKIKKLQEKLTNLGPMLPGSLSEQWNVCGKKVCRCKAKTKSQKHGPYYQLSYTVNKKSSSLFIKKEDLAEVKKRISNYKTFKVLNTRLLSLWVEEAKERGFKDE